MQAQQRMTVSKEANESHKERKLFAVLPRSPERPFQVFANNFRIASLCSREHTHSFSCLPAPLRLQGLNKCSWWKFRRWCNLPVWSRTGSCLKVRAKDLDGAKWDKLLHRDQHTFTHHPPAQTHTHTHPKHTPVMQKLTQPPCYLLPNGLILVLNPSHNPIDAVSHCRPTAASEWARPPVTTRQ